MLGLFVAALAHQSDLAVVADVALAGSLVAAVLGFRKGTLKLAQSREAGDPGYNASIFSEPLRQDQVDQYYVNYRGGQDRVQVDSVMAVGADGSEPRPSSASRRKLLVAAAPSRLSA